MALFKNKKKEINSIDDGIKCYNLKSKGKYEIVIKDNFISIHTKGVMNAMNKGLVGNKKIDMNNISAVQYKAPGLTTGYLQFVLIGSQEVKGGLMAAAKDENTILFAQKEQDQVLEIKQHVEKFISEKSKRSSGQTVSAADEILKFKKLLEMEVINQEEFDRKKNELLNI